MAKHDQGKRVGAGGDAAATIGDDLFTEGANLIEAATQLVRRQEGVCCRVEQMSGGEVDAALDPARSAIAVAAGAGMLLRRQGVQRADGAVANRLQHILLTDHQRAPLTDDEISSRARPSRARFDWTAFAAP